jgi:hypothetical protein
VEAHSGGGPGTSGSKRLSPTALLALAGTIIGLVSGIVALVFLFKPDLKPSGEAPKQAATLSRLSVEPRATFREYLARVELSARPYKERELARRGALLRFRVAITGFEGKRLILRWELFNRASGELIKESKATSIRPTTETNEAVWYFWVPLPRRPGKFYAVVELEQQKKQHRLALDTLQTDPLRGLS